MSRKPIIMISWGPCIDNKFFTQGMMVSKAFAWAIANNGGIPLVPLDHHDNTPEEYAAMADGLLMPGGQCTITRCSIKNRTRSLKEYLVRSPIQQIFTRRLSGQENLFLAFATASRRLIVKKAEL